MPVITEQELQGFNEKSAKLQILTTDHEYLQESCNKTKKQRNLFLGLAILFLIGLAIIFLLKSLRPELFINGYKLESRGLTLIETKNYQALKALEAESMLLEEKNTQTNEGDDLASEQESIGDKTVFAVQIGAYNNNYIELFSDSFSQFREFEEDEFYKYTIGAYETLKEAQELRKKIIKLGIEDAFVASYINGKRQAIEEAY